MASLYTEVWLNGELCMWTDTVAAYTSDHGKSSMPLTFSLEINFWTWLEMPEVQLC